MSVDVAEVLVFAAGVVLVLSTVLSAIRTIVLPHGPGSNITKLLFLGVRRVFDVRQHLPVGERVRHDLGALYPPLTLVLLPLTWLTISLAGFACMYWALGVKSARAAFDVAGSTMLTLEASGYDDLPRTTLSFVSAALTMSVLALLLVTYLPSIYQAYSSREQQVMRLGVMAGEPPSVVALLVRLDRIGGVNQLDELFDSWRRWFEEARETHTALPAVVLFRSASPERQWVSAATTVLDAAALCNAVRYDDEELAHASLCIRAGSMALTDIADTYGLATSHDPRPDDPISVDRARFVELYDAVEAAGLVRRHDREAAWRAWAGWRVNYDASAVALTTFTGADRRRLDPARER